METGHRQDPGGGREAVVPRWRRRRLVAAGFEPALAARVAREGGIDLHELLDLVDRGCPPATAVRILAPLDEDPDR
jgi:hypothetical protein